MAAGLTVRLRPEAPSPEALLTKPSEQWTVEIAAVEGERTPLLDALVVAIPLTKVRVVLGVAASSVAFLARPVLSETVEAVLLGEVARP